MWDLPGTGIELVSPALSGGFLTTGPPGKSQSLFLIETQNSLILLLFAIWHLGAGFPRPPAITGATGFKSQILALSPHLLTSARWGFRFDTAAFLTSSSMWPVHTLEFWQAQPQEVAGDNLTFMCLPAGVASVAWQPGEKSKFTLKQNLSNHKSKGEGGGKQVGEGKKGILSYSRSIENMGFAVSWIAKKMYFFCFSLYPLQNRWGGKKQGTCLQSIQSLTQISGRKPL